MRTNQEADSSLIPGDLVQCELGSFNPVAVVKTSVADTNLQLKGLRTKNAFHSAGKHFILKTPAQGLFIVT